MKKWFNHTKRPIQKFNEYEEDGYEWEDWIDQIETADIENAEAVAYEAEEAETVYYSDINEEEYIQQADAGSQYYEENQAAAEEQYYTEEALDEGEYYAEEAPIEGEHYAEEAAAEGQYYAEEAPIEGEYYAEEVDAEGQYYAEEAPIEGEYYAEEAGAEGQYYTEKAPIEGEYYAEEMGTEGQFYAEEAPIESEYYAEEAAAEGQFYAEEAPIEGEYYAEETGTEAQFYAEEAPIESEYYADETDTEGQYYTEEALDEGEYYAEEMDTEGQFYAEEAPIEGEYYAEEAGAEGQYYAEEAPIEGEYYAEEADARITYYAEEAGTADEYYAEDIPVENEYSDKEKKPGFAILNFFQEMGAMDRVVAITGVAVLLLALVTGGVFLSRKTDEDAVSAFASVGSQLEGIELIGEQGLLAVADAEKARIAAAEALKAEQEQQQQEQQGYDEEDYNKEVKVSLNLVSVQKDLKIKFTNKDSGKLISNVPFVVTVTDPDGKSDTWTDDDMDGIIYKKGITPGKYQVKVETLADAKYESYKLPSDTSTVEVKKEIVYEKIDVSNEIKTETEVNVAQEDTKKNETVVESTLQDTVTWVESSVTANTYIEVAKNTIPDPAISVAKNITTDTLVAAEGAAPASNLPATNDTLISPLLATNARVLRLTNYTASINPSSQSLNVGGSFTVTAECADVNMADITWISSDPSVATVAGNGTTAVVTAVASGSAAISYTANGTAVSGGDAVTGLTGTCMVSVNDTKGTVTVDNENVTVLAGAQLSVKATAAGFTAGKNVVYTVAVGHPNVATATVDAATGNVVITGVAPGDAVVTVFANYENGAVATAASVNINIKVVNNLTMTLDKTAATVYLNEPLTINAAIPNASTEIPVTAESSDTTVATVAVNKHAVTITGVKAGSAVITVKYVQNGVEAKATCAVTVTVNPKTDKTTKLKDNTGNQLYVLEGNTYREAVRADYYTADKFFIKGDVKYTGWQTIDGKVYFFDASGKKVTGEQVIQGAKYNFASDGSLVTGSGTMGIDVSKWNGNIDWKAVKNSGVSYVIIRCGYRGSSKGALIEDPKFKTNIEGAIAAGLKVGVYFFTQAVDEVEAVEEASMVLSLVSKYKISYPIFLDVEPSGGRGDKIDKATRTAVCKAFCKTIQDAGYTAGIYANKTWLTEKLDASALNAYKIWLAQYAAAPTYTGKYDLWQYKSTGRVSGISGDVDLNLSYLGY